MKIAVAVLSLVACGKAADNPAPAPGSAAAAPKRPPPSAPPPAKPTIKDDGAKQLLAKGTSCKLQQDALPLDCPEYKAIGDYAFQHQGSTDASETCAAFLSDPDPLKKKLAAECLAHFNAVGVTPSLGFALDAIDAEKDPKIREEIAWGIKSAEAVTAHLEERVLSVVHQLAADPKTETAASYVFSSLFPQYMMGSGPKPPAKAQALAIASLRTDGTAMQREAFNAVKLLDDKAAVCAAIDADLTPAAKQWALAADALADMKDACVANLAKTIDFVLARLAAGDDHLEILRRYDSVF
ncbi:MAG TPA: hypothetical protein VFQ65_04350, partial [Kofleriaceae bacterium]|nr:hypothetical protein [Kofleriaceae bacterium]